MRLKIVLALAVVAVVATSASAATVQLGLILNPAVPGCNGCTLSGANTYDLVALDSAGDNFGIASYGISITGVTSALHRSPRMTSAVVNTADPEEVPDLAGFTNLRSGNNLVVIPGGFQIGGSQDVITPTTHLIKGFGQAAGSFASIPLFQSGGVVTQPTWGSPLLIAEGQYAAGATPTIDFSASSSSIVVFNTAGGSGVTGAALAPLQQGGNPPVVTSLSLINPVGALNATVSGAPTATNNPTSWSPALNSLVLDHYTPGFGALAGAPGLALAALWNPATQAFSWNTSGSTRGTYVWNVSATNASGTGNGTVTVEQHAVPEPASLTLLGLATIGLVGFARRRG